MVIESALHELNEWSSDIEMPEMHAEIDRENEERRKRAEYWKEDGAKEGWEHYKSPLADAYESATLTDRQQNILNDKLDEVNRRYNKIESDVKHLFALGMHTVLRDKKYKELENLPEQKINGVWTAPALEYLVQKFDKEDQSCMKVFGEMDEGEILWWVLETYGNYENGDEGAFAKTWKQMRAWITRARKRELQKVKDEILRSFGW